jgi:hypothetical protein
VLYCCLLLSVLLGARIQWCRRSQWLLAAVDYKIRSLSYRTCNVGSWKSNNCDHERCVLLRSMRQQHFQNQVELTRIWRMRAAEPSPVMLIVSFISDNAIASKTPHIEPCDIEINCSREMYWRTRQFVGWSNRRAAEVVTLSFWSSMVDPSYRLVHYREKWPCGSVKSILETRALHRLLYRHRNCGHIHVS